MVWGSFEPELHLLTVTQQLQKHQVSNQRKPNWFENTVGGLGFQPSYHTFSVLQLVPYFNLVFLLLLVHRIHHVEQGKRGKCFFVAGKWWGRQEYPPPQQKPENNWILSEHGPNFIKIIMYSFAWSKFCTELLAWNSMGIHMKQKPYFHIRVWGESSPPPHNCLCSCRSLSVQNSNPCDDFFRKSCSVLGPLISI